MKITPRHPLLIAFAISLVINYSEAATFMPGDLYFASNVAPTQIYNITGGGDLSSQPAFATAGASGNRSLGQIAWSNDRETMYVSNYAGSTIYSVSPSGVSSLYASAPSPTGMIMTATGRLLVVEYSNTRVMDYSNPTIPLLFADLPSVARNMQQLPTGEILVAGDSNNVYDISSGTATVYATIAGASGSYLGDIDFTSDGRVFVTGGFSSAGNIYEITGGGLISSSPYATITGAGSGAAFGLAIDRTTDQLLVAPLSQPLIIDITGGGTFDASDPGSIFATLPSTSDMALDFVPIPEPHSIGLLLIGVAAAIFRRRKSR